MVPATAFVGMVMIPLNEKWGYIWGYAGIVWTAALQQREAKKRRQTRLYGAKWIGRRVCDCSGLVKWAISQLGVALPHSSSLQHGKCKATGKLKSGVRDDGKPIKPGTLVFLYDAKNNPQKPWHHVGVYVGNGVCVEAKGTQYGVTTSHLSHWHDWGELAMVDYSGEKGDTPQPVRLTIRQGNTGALVKEAQELLIECGYLGAGQADGVFGSKTLAAVRAFQASRGLTADGIIGPLTWAALDRAVAVMDEETYVATLRGLTAKQAQAVKTDWPEAIIERERDDSNA